MSVTRNRQQSFLARWLHNHPKTYAAHAVWADNVELVLQGGFLKSSEHVLRDSYYVSFEIGFYGERGECDISILLQTLKAQSITLPSCLQVIKEDKNTVIVDVNLFGIGYDLQSTELDYGDQLRKLCKKFGSWEYPIQIAHDLLSQHPIDKRLATIWNAKQKKEGNKLKLFSSLLNMRTNEILKNGVLPEIRATYNRINWSYGDVVILRGNPEAIISLGSHTTISNMLKDFDAITLTPGQEVALLHPLENNGNFFSLALKEDEHVLIIGPKAVLMLYAESYPNLMFLENMNQKSLEFFHVPLRLRPKINLALSETMSICVDPEYFVQDSTLIEGKSLFQVLREHRLDRPAMLALLLKIALSIAQTSCTQLTRSQDILLAKVPQAKLNDIKTTESENYQNYIPYLATECLSAQFSPTAIVYCFGVVMIEALIEDITIFDEAFIAYKKNSNGFTAFQQDLSVGDVGDILDGLIDRHIEVSFEDGVYKEVDLPLLFLIAHCTDSEPGKRPTLNHIILQLQNIIARSKYYLKKQALIPNATVSIQQASYANFNLFAHKKANSNLSERLQSLSVFANTK